MLKVEKTGRQQFVERRKKLAMEAMAAALKMRQFAGIKLWAPVCAYDLADKAGIEVRFVDFPSMEGMYRKTGYPLILVSALRPSGRQAFTCAHELGHHVFKHGDRIDEIIGQEKSQEHFEPEEFLADCFAGFLLMPKSAVDRAFALRSWNPRSCTPLQLYTIAGWLGVGYTSLIHHMSNTLHLISQPNAQSLLKVQPYKLRSMHLGEDIKEELVIVDNHWSDRAVDIQVGDFIQLPGGVISEGNCTCLYKQNEQAALFRGATPGIGRFYQYSTGWSTYVRVSRRNYIGRSIFRHLEDSSDE